MQSIIIIIVIFETISIEKKFIAFYNHPKIFLNLIIFLIIAKIIFFCNFFFNLIKKIKNIVYFGIYNFSIGHGIFMFKIYYKYYT